MDIISCNAGKIRGTLRFDPATLAEKGEFNLADRESVISRPDPALIQRARKCSTATLAEAAGKRIDLPAAIKPIAPEMRVCGPATTVSSPGLDNLPLHRAIYVANPGDVLVVEVSGKYEAGYWGEIMTCAALHRKIAGLVIDGCVRDSEAIAGMEFPVFSRGLCIHGTAKREKGLINSPIMIGEVCVRPGDLVVGDKDGVVVIPQPEVLQVFGAAEKRKQKEDGVKEQLAAGKTTLEIYGW